MNDIVVMTPLDDLAAQIKAEHLAFRNAVITHALKCGDLLLQAKAKVPHGEFLPWLEKNCDISDRTAQRYMRLAEHRLDIESKSDIVSDLTLTGALKVIGKEKADAEARATRQWNRSLRGQAEAEKYREGFEAGRAVAAKAAEADPKRIAYPAEEAAAIAAKPTTPEEKRMHKIALHSSGLAAKVEGGTVTVDEALDQMKEHKRALDEPEYIGPAPGNGADLAAALDPHFEALWKLADARTAAAKIERILADRGYIPAGERIRDAKSYLRRLKAEESNGTESGLGIGETKH